MVTKALTVRIAVFRARTSGRGQHRRRARDRDRPPPARPVRAKVSGTREKTSGQGKVSKLARS